MQDDNSGSLDTKLAEIFRKFDLTIGYLANLANSDENARIVLKSCLTSVNALQAQLSQLSAIMAHGLSASEDNIVRLAAIEAAALIKSKAPDQAFHEPRPMDAQEDWRALLKRHRPETFDLWMRLFEHSLPFYETAIEASCSTWDNRYAVAFRDYLTLFAEGYLLDVGSGTLKRPVYLEGYPAELLRGLDPRQATAATDFPVATGVNEFIPWADESFQTLCNATSLDHVIDLGKALDECARVLCAKGRLVLWYAHVPGSAQPNAGAAPEAVDEFHLFHLDDDWFLPMVQKRFRVIDRRIFPSGAFSHVFAAYEKT